MRHSSGFTLMEMLLYGALAALVGVILVGVLVSSSGIFFRQNATVAQGVAINDAQAMIADYIKQSSAVAASYTDGSTTYTSNVSTLVLMVPSINAQGATIANKSDYIVFTPNPQKLYLLVMHIFPDAVSSRKSGERILATNLSTIDFTFLDNSGNVVSPIAAIRIRATITLAEKAGSDQKFTSVSNTVNIKNN